MYPIYIRNLLRKSHQGPNIKPNLEREKMLLLLNPPNPLSSAKLPTNKEKEKKKRKNRSLLCFYLTRSSPPNPSQPKNLTLPTPWRALARDLPWRALTMSSPWCSLSSYVDLLSARYLCLGQSHWSWAFFLFLARIFFWWVEIHFEIDFRRKS